MNGYIGHFKTVCRHKYYVAKECFKYGLYWRGIVHDLSKFTPVEFIESAKYYSGKSSPISASKKANGYSKAWLHHKGRNKHHWEYWTDFKNGVPFAATIPEKYLIEMCCDILGAAKSYESNNALRYFESHVHLWLATKETIDYVRDFLSRESNPWVF